METLVYISSNVTHPCDLSAALDTSNGSHSSFWQQQSSLVLAKGECGI